MSTDLQIPPTHRVMFRRLKNDIKERMDQGYSITAIWKALRDSGQISMSYSQFCRHIQATFPEREKKQR